MKPIRPTRAHERRLRAREDRRDQVVRVVQPAVFLQLDGMPRRRLDVWRLNTLGWRPRIPLLEGFENTYEWFKENYAEGSIKRGS